MGVRVKRWPISDGAGKQSRDERWKMQRPDFALYGQKFSRLDAKN
jgi:hypothetical protein